MKEHTLVFSGKAFVGLGVALVAGGALLFSVGLFVGIAVTEGSAGGKTAAQPATVAMMDTPPATEDAAAWPFGGAAATKPSPDTTGAGTSAADPARDGRRSGTDGEVSAPAPAPAANSSFRAVAYVAPARTNASAEEARRTSFKPAPSAVSAMPRPSQPD